MKIDAVLNNKIGIVGLGVLGSAIAECFVNKESLSKFMVRSGYAFDYPKYSKKQYAEDEKYARNNNLGIWNMKFEYPWEWRKKIREGKNE